MESFVSVDSTSDFSIHNLPYGVFSDSSNVRQSAISFRNYPVFSNSSDSSEHFDHLSVSKVKICLIYPSHCNRI